MKKMVYVDPGFKHLRDDIETYFSAAGDGRSGILSQRGEMSETVKIGDVEVDVRWCGGGSWLDAVALRSGLNSQAKRMYNESLWLDAHGVEVPKAIGYIEIIGGGVVGRSAFLSRHRKLEAFLPMLREGMQESKQAMALFAEMLHRLHDLGIFGHDVLMRNIQFESFTHKPVWMVDGKLSIQHKAIPSRGTIRDLESMGLSAQGFKLLVEGYLESTMESAYDSFEHWAFYQDIQKWADKQQQETVWQ
ncbi:MAG: hypothetical protein QM786_05920 [Breznakibacter sp.]